MVAQAEQARIIIVVGGKAVMNVNGDDGSTCDHVLE